MAAGFQAAGIPGFLEHEGTNKGKVRPDLVLSSAQTTRDGIEHLAPLAGPARRGAGERRQAHRAQQQVKKELGISVEHAALEVGLCEFPSHPFVVGKDATWLWRAGLLGRQPGVDLVLVESFELDIPPDSIVQAPLLEVPVGEGFPCPEKVDQRQQTRKATHARTQVLGTEEETVTG